MEDSCYWMFHKSLCFSLDQWIGLIGTLLGLFGIIAAFILYYLQRRDNKRDAFNSFQDNLKDLQNTVTTTIERLEDFSSNLDLPNDAFGNPNIPPSLNDKFLDRINISDLNRYYSKISKNSIYRQFIVDCNYIGAYYSHFVQESSFFREKFLDFENEFRNHRLLFANKYYETIGENKTNHNFKLSYRSIVKELKNDKDVLDNNGGLMNRDGLVDKHISKLIEESYKYIFTESGVSEGNENEINQLANIVKSARLDMNTTKNSMKGLINRDIERFKLILATINQLIE